MPNSTGEQGPMRWNRRIGMSAARGALWAAVLLWLVAASCGCRAQHLVMGLRVFAAEQSLEKTLRTYDSKAVPLECEFLEGDGQVYAVSNYQWARLRALARAERGVQETLAGEFEMGPDDGVLLDLATRLGERLEGEVQVTPDGCCEYTLSNVTYTLRGPAGPRGLEFCCMYPLVRNVLAELRPVAQGQTWAWILIDVREADPDAPKPDPRKG
jgi:hypothetical protein